MSTDDINTSNAGDSFSHNGIEGSCFDKMDMLVDKLNFLNYKQDFLSNSSLDSNPLSREYFAIAHSNTIVQFHQFTLLASWFFNLIRQNSFYVDEFDDPNKIVRKVMLELQLLGFQHNLSVSKVKQGHGAAVLDILNFLADKALEKNNFSFEVLSPSKNTIIQAPESDEEIVIEDEASEEEEEHFYHDNSTDESLNSSGTMSIHIIESNIDISEWTKELRRVTPMLKENDDNLDHRNNWRYDFQLQRHYTKEVKDKSPKTINYLTTFCKHLENDMGRIQVKEDALTRNFERHCKQYVKMKSELCEYKNVNNQLREELDNKSKELDDLKTKIKEHKILLDRRGDSMTNTSPLVKLKAALNRIKTDIKEFDIQIALLDNTLTKANYQEFSQSGNPRGISRHDSSLGSDVETSSHGGSHCGSTSLQQ